MMETIRRVVRGQLGYRSPAYRFAARTYGDATVLIREGRQTLSRLRALEASPAAEIGDAVPVAFSNLDHPLYLRPGTEDIGAAVNNIVRREYGQFRPAVPPRTMVDAGAYIGDTSAYFLSRFPSLKVIALEPNPDSFPLAQRNLAPYGDRVDLRQEALCATAGVVRFGGEQMGARVGGEGHEVRATTICELLNDFPEPRIDVLKLDIEGAETKLFAAGAEDWLSKVTTIIVETHGPKSTEQVLTTLETRGWLYSRYRNLYFCSAGLA